MAMYHMNAQVISRSSGRSSVAAAAYRSGTKLTNERDGNVHDYSKKTGVVHSEIVLPDTAPRRWLDRSTLWNEVEKVERSSNAQLAREIEYALPREFGRDEQVAFARAFAQTFADEGMVADFSIHDGKSGNPHVHMLLGMRPCDEEGFAAKSVNAYLVRDMLGNEQHATVQELKALGDGWAKVYRYKNGEDLTRAQAELAGLHPTRDRKGKAAVQENRNLVDWNTPEKLVEWRKRLADMQNERLVANGSDARVDHRSFAERGIEQMPTVHEGHAVRKAEAAEEARAKREGREYQPVTQRRKQNVWVQTMNRRLIEMVEKAKRSFTQFRRTLLAAHHAQSANARKRSLQAQRAGRRTAHNKSHEGLSR